MKKPITCPLCGKRLLDNIKGDAKIEGGPLGAWCKKCRTTIEIYGDCKTRVVDAKSA